MRLPRTHMIVMFMLVVVLCAASFSYVWKTNADPDFSGPYIRDLGRGDIPQRREAAAMLGELGMQAGPGSVPILARVVRNDPDAEVRWIAAGALAEMTLIHPTAAEALMGALGDPEVRVRMTAASSLARYLPIPGVEEALVKAFADPSASVRAEAVSSFGLGESASPPTEDAIVLASRDPASTVRVAAIRVLVRFSRPAPPGASLADHGLRLQRFDMVRLEGLRDKSAEVRRAAANSMRFVPFSSHAEPSVLIGALIEALRDPDAQVRRMAAAALGGASMTTPTGSAGSAGAAGSLIAESLPAIPPLYRALADDVMRVEAEHALREIGGRATWARVVPGEALRLEIAEAMQSALSHENPSVRASAVATLTSIDPLAGGDSSSLAAGFEHALADPETSVRLAATNGLTLLALFATNDPMSREDFLRQSLADLGRSLGNSQATWGAIKAVATRTIRLDESEDMRVLRKCVPRLTDALDDPDPHIRRLAYITLWRCWALQNPRSQALRETLRARSRIYEQDLASPDALAKEIAAWALGWVDPDDVAKTIAAMEASRPSGTPSFRVRLDASLLNLKRQPQLPPYWPYWERETR